MSVDSARDGGSEAGAGGGGGDELSAMIMSTSGLMDLATERKAGDTGDAQEGREAGTECAGCSKGRVGE